MTENEKYAEMFNNLNKIDLTGHTKQKLGLTYLSWAWAWAELKKRYPSAQRKIYTHTIKYTTSYVVSDSGISQTFSTESEEEVNYFTDGKTCYVKVGVIIDGLEQIETLPVMNMKNQSVPVASVTSIDVNRAIQRAFVKACAMHGLGLYIYAGEDLPQSDPIVIDWKKLTNMANDIKSVPAEEMSRFKEHMNNTLELMKKFGQTDFGPNIAAYITTQTPTNVSKITPDKFINLYRIEKFLTGLLEITNE